MNAPVKSVAVSAPAIDVAVLAEMLKRNRFMPEPPHDQVFVGDGAFRAVGAEFLRHVVEIGGLQPHERFLDIGSGIGRLAVPLTQYLDPDAGSYDGVDPVAAGVAWCAEHITPAYPRFRFHHLDIRHAEYNPGGTVEGTSVTLPFADGSFDIAAMISVATHLPAAEIDRYAAEAARLLVPGGRLLLTAFVIDADAQGRSATWRLKFARKGDTPEWHMNAEHPLAAIAFDDGLIDRIFAGHGLVVLRRLPGHWSGWPTANFQDMFLIGKAR
jgi:SAM-dependent methyltransferase